MKMSSQDSPIRFGWMHQLSAKTQRKMKERHEVSYRTGTTPAHDETMSGEEVTEGSVDEHYGRRREPPNGSRGRPCFSQALSTSTPNRINPRSRVHASLVCWRMRSENARPRWGGGCAWRQMPPRHPCGGWRVRSRGVPPRHAATNRGFGRCRTRAFAEIPGRVGCRADCCDWPV